MADYNIKKLHCFQIVIQAYAPWNVEIIIPIQYSQCHALGVLTVKYVDTNDKYI